MALKAKSFSNPSTILVAIAVEYVNVSTSIASGDKDVEYGQLPLSAVKSATWSSPIEAEVESMAVVPTIADEEEFHILVLRCTNPIVLQYGVPKDRAAVGGVGEDGHWRWLRVCPRLLA